MMIMAYSPVRLGVLENHVCAHLVTVRPPYVDVVTLPQVEDHAEMPPWGHVASAQAGALFLALTDTVLSAFPSQPFFSAYPHI